MADVLECYEVWDLGQGANERTQIDAIGASQTSADVGRHFYIRTNADSVTQVKIFQETQGSATWPVPDRGEPHSENPYLFATDFRLRRIGPRHWIMDVVYESVGATQNPLEEPPQETWATQMWTAPVNVDANGAPILNAADEGYDETLTREFADLVMTYSFNAATFDTSFWFPFVNTVNAGSFRDFPAGTGRIMSITAQSRTRGSVTYFRVTITIAFRNYWRKGQDGQFKQLGWTKVVVNKGFRLKKTSPARYEPIYDDGILVRKPALLSADGSTRITDPAQATFREHPLYEAADWSGLGIG